MIRIRRRSGMSLVSLSIYVFVILIMSTFIISKANPDRLEDDGLRDLAMALDTSLSQWYSFHSGTYPDNLNLMIQACVIPEKTPVNKFTYSISPDKTKYRMEVILGNGSWQTPGSNL